MTEAHDDMPVIPENHVNMIPKRDRHDIVEHDEKTRTGEDDTRAKEREHTEF